jgi:hypothetical protein
MNRHYGVQSALAAALLLLTAPALAQQQPAPPLGSQQPVHVLSLWRCPAENVPKFTEYNNANVVPVLDRLVREGKLDSYGFLRHFWGDEWNVGTFYHARTSAAFFAAYDEMVLQVRQKDPNFPQSVAPFCTEHKDSIYLLARVVPAPGQAR